MLKIFKNILFGKNTNFHQKNEIEWALTDSLDKNIDLIKNIFQNDDTIIFREFSNDDKSSQRFCLIFIDGMINNKIVNESIIEPIMRCKFDKFKNKDFLYKLKENIIISNTIKITDDFNEIVSLVLYGCSLLLIDNQNKAIIVDTKGFNERAITEPISETVVRGSRESFTETIMTSLTLLRRKIQSPNLKFKFREVGRLSKTKICLCYIDGIVNQNILDEVNRRIDDIDIDAVLESGYIEELIKDSPLSPFSTVGSTERPDIVASKLLEGRIAIFIDGTPFVLTVPFLFIEYFQANEDYYNQFLFGTINRILRIITFFLATSIPAIYVALTTFHQEMIPTPLLLSISASREGLPFPTIVEAILMLLAFEILRESGIRLPSPIGSSISFVGAIILGQAAVEARLVSAPIVIITALSGISNFLTFKMLEGLIVVRTTFLLLSGFLGLYGYIFGVIGLVIHLMSMRSFGVPYMSYIGSLKFQELKDTAIRAPWWLMYYRPRLLARSNLVRQKYYDKTKEVKNEK